MYAVCTVRLRLVRAEGLGYGSDMRVENPLIMAQIHPWNKTRKTRVFYGAGQNPRWVGTQDTDAGDHSIPYIDLPYYGHPYSEKIPSVTVMAFNIPKNIEDFDEEEEGRGSFSALNPEYIGRSSFDLRPYLSENKNMIHGLTLSLTDQNQNHVGKIVCTLQFVLTGIMRLTVLSGQRIISSIHDDENIEPYIEARLVPGKNKWRKTVHKQGRNPEWGLYTRKPTLASFNVTRMNIFSSKSSMDYRKPSRNGQSNILEFNYKDKDRSVVPVLAVRVKDKMNTPMKKKKQMLEEKRRVEKLENQIKDLRSKSKSSGSKIATAVSATFDGSPKIMTKGFAGIFKKTLPRKKHARKKRKANANFKEMDVAQVSKTKPLPESDLDEIPIASDEAELTKQLKLASKKLKSFNASGLEPEVEDQLIATGSIDLRPLLKYDGKRTSFPITVDLTDENGLTSGTLNCIIEFENSAYDPTQEVLQIPDFRLNLSKASYREFVRELHKIKTKDIVIYIKNVYIFADVLLDLYAPGFVKRTSTQTKMPKLVVFTLFFSFAALFLLSLWKGLGNEFLSYIVCILYPTYQSFKALEKKNTDLNNQWLTYWIIFGMFNLLEKTILLPFVFVYPASFFIFKFVLFLWLTNPQTLGASIVYYMVIAPLIRVYEDEIDTYISVFGKTTKNFVTDFASFYDQFEQEMSFAVSKNLANENIFNPKTQKKPLSLEVKEIIENSSISGLKPKTLKVLVTAEGKGRGKVMKIDVEDKLEDVLIQVCGRVGIPNFNDYSLFYIYKGQEVLLEDVTDLAKVGKPRLFLKKMA